MRSFIGEVGGRKKEVKEESISFPSDFMIQLTASEAKEIQALRSQFATLKRGKHIKPHPET
jgi:hypothetical protein